MGSRGPARPAGGSVRRSRGRGLPGTCARRGSRVPRSGRGRTSFLTCPDHMRSKMKHASRKCIDLYRDAAVVNLSHRQRSLRSQDVSKMEHSMTAARHHRPGGSAALPAHPRGGETPARRAANAVVQDRYLGRGPPYIRSRAAASSMTAISVIDYLRQHTVQPDDHARRATSRQPRRRRRSPRRYGRDSLDMRKAASAGSPRRPGLHQRVSTQIRGAAPL